MDMNNQICRIQTIKQTELAQTTKNILDTENIWWKKTERE